MRKSLFCVGLCIFAVVVNACDDVHEIKIVVDCCEYYCAKGLDAVNAYQFPKDGPNRYACADVSLCDCSASRDNCGNQIIDKNEICDGDNVAGKTCDDLVAGTVGPLSCQSDCLEFDVSQCQPVTPVCGDGEITGEEVCDGENLGDKTCQDIVPNTTGTLSCQSDCLEFDVSQCQPELPKTCGNGQIDENEVCDGEILGGRNCASLGTGYTGLLKCSDDCLEYDESGCVPPELPKCGNGVLDDGEFCDGDIFRAPYTCKSIFGPGSEGELKCDSTCLHFNMSGCTPAMNFDNGSIQINERCDMSYNNGQAPCSEYYGADVTGMRMCNEMGRYDISACMSAEHCGNGIVEPELGESCDPGISESYDRACEDTFGPGSTGIVVCDRLCKYSTTLCTVSEACGNDVVDNGTNGRPNYSEVCDPGDLKKKTCAHLGTGYHGELGCLINCSGFDFSNCEPPGV